MSKSTNKTAELVLLLALLVAAWWYGSTQLHIGLPGSSTEQTRPVAITNGAHDLRGTPSLTGSQIDSIICKYGSPACGQGDSFYQLSLQYGINDAYPLAFYWHESNYGTQGVARFSKSIGNLRCIPTADCVGGYAYFRYWQDGIRAWYVLIHNLYFAAWHRYTVEQIIPKYAPPDDNNDVPAYINNVIATVNSYER